MNFIDFVHQHNQVLFQQGKRKQALDLAKLLDSDAYQTSIETADDRKHLLGYFNSVCRSAGLIPPPFESELAAALMPKPLSGSVKARVDDLITHIRNQVGDDTGGTHDQLLVLAEALRILPQIFGNNSQEAIIAHARYGLTLSGKDAPLPYGSDNVIGGTNQKAPSNRVSVLIVDDQLPAITRTAVAMSGWPGIDIDFVHFTELQHDNTARTDLAQQVLNQNPNIVLMDQNLHYLTGSQVIREINRIAPMSGIIFIGNTDGRPFELNHAGAIGNCGKGVDLHPLIQVLSIL